MRITDNRYAGERGKFDLALRMIQLEARTGTIRTCTGFSEDRIRKIYAHYFAHAGPDRVRRRRGKSPTQIGPFLSSARRQTEATLLACLFVYFRLIRLGRRPAELQPRSRDGLALGERLCDAYEAHVSLYPAPQLSFEWAWNLYQSLACKRELHMAWCNTCLGPYVQDAFALDYGHCPLCQLKDLALTS